MTSTELLYSDPLAAATAAAAEIAERTGVASHDVALVMGSGWVTAADALGKPAYECDAHELTGFFAPAVEGHSGKVRSYEITEGGKTLRALVFLGRTHLYERKRYGACGAWSPYSSKSWVQGNHSDQCLRWN